MTNAHRQTDESRAVPDSALPEGFRWTSAEDFSAAPTAHGAAVAPGISIREHLAAAFHAVTRSTGPTGAFRRSKDFYRSGGGAWTRHLD